MADSKPVWQRRPDSGDGDDKVFRQRQWGSGRQKRPEASAVVPEVTELFPAAKGAAAMASMAVGIQWWQKQPYSSTASRVSPSQAAATTDVFSDDVGMAAALPLRCGLKATLRLPSKKRRQRPHDSRARRIWKHRRRLGGAIPSFVALSISHLSSDLQRRWLHGQQRRSSIILATAVRPSRVARRQLASTTTRNGVVFLLL